jgi:hypothetical protein
MTKQQFQVGIMILVAGTTIAVTIIGLAVVALIPIVSLSVQSANATSE